MKTIDGIILLGQEENMSDEPWELKAFVIASVVLTIAVLLFLL